MNVSMSNYPAMEQKLCSNCRWTGTTGCAGMDCQNNGLKMWSPVRRYAIGAAASPAPVPVPVPVEVDPNGKDQHEPGAKLDAGKLRAGLVFTGFALALQEVARVGTYGAQKYTDNGWQHVPNGVARYTDAMHRHLLAEAAGEACDKDTGIAHAAHAAWNALARLELALRGAA